MCHHQLMQLSKFINTLKISLNSIDMIPGQVSFQITEGKINCTIYINDMVDPQHNQTQEIMRCFISHVAHI